MNRFDRVTAILLLLQGRSVVTAAGLADRFGVTERTIYRDIRSLESAGVPICAEAGVGYFLQRDYALPPVRFSFDEAAALLLAEKMLGANLDAATRGDFAQALDKVRVVLNRTDSDLLGALDQDTAVLPTAHAAAAGATDGVGDLRVRESSDRWLPECRNAVIHRRVVVLSYRSAPAPVATDREIEPIGLIHYAGHWHLIAWCRLREGYRDFRLDRMARLDVSKAHSARHSRLTLQQYLDSRAERESLVDVALVFTPKAAQFVGASRYSFGLVEESSDDVGVHMRFLTHVPQYMARWLMQFGDGVSVARGEPVRAELQRLSTLAAAHWQQPKV